MNKHGHDFPSLIRWLTYYICIYITYYIYIYITYYIYIYITHYIYIYTYKEPDKKVSKRIPEVRKVKGV